MVNTAVILAAGLGSRLGHLTREMPKGFIELGGRSLIEHSITKLIEQGISDIIIGTGHLAPAFERLGEKYPQIRCHKNSRYEETGSMYTLYCLRDLVKTDFLLLESDLLYEKRGLQVLLEDDRPDLILASGRTASGDEVYIEFDDRSHLVNMSKKESDLNKISAELVGISKISYPTFLRLCAFSEGQFSSNPKLDYEHALVAVSKQGLNIPVKKLEDYIWCEIDDLNHLHRAQTIIYPQILARQTQ